MATSASSRKRETKPLSLNSLSSNRPLSSPTFRTRSPTIQPSSSPTLGFISEYAYLSTLAAKSSPTSPHRSVADARPRGMSEPVSLSSLHSPLSPPNIIVNGQTGNTHNHTATSEGSTPSKPIVPHLLPQKPVEGIVEDRTPKLNRIKAKNQVVYRRDLTETLEQDVTVVMFPRDETLTRASNITLRSSTIESTTDTSTKELTVIPSESLSSSREDVSDQPVTGEGNGGGKVARKRSFLSKDGKKKEHKKEKEQKKEKEKEQKKEKEKEQKREKEQKKEEIKKETKKEKKKSDNLKRMSGGGLSKWSMPNLSSRDASDIDESPSPQRTSVTRSFFKKKSNSDKQKAMQKTGWTFTESTGVPPTTSELLLPIIGESSEAPPSYELATRTVSMDCLYSPQGDVPLTIFKPSSTDDISSDEDNERVPTLSPLMPDILKDRQDSSPLSMESIIIDVPDLVPSVISPQPTVELHHTDTISTDTMATQSDTMATQPDTTATQSDIMATQPDTMAMQSDTTAAQPDSTVDTQPDTKSSQPNTKPPDLKHSDAKITSDSMEIHVSTKSSKSHLDPEVNRKESVDSVDGEKGKKKFTRFTDSRKPIRKQSTGGKGSPALPRPVSLTPQPLSKITDTDEGASLRSFSQSPSKISLSSLDGSSPSPRSTPIFKPKGRVSTTDVKMSPTNARKSPNATPTNAKRASSLRSKGTPSSPKATTPSSPKLNRKPTDSFRSSAKKSPLTTPTNSPKLSGNRTPPTSPGPAQLRKSVGKSPSSPLAARKARNSADNKNSVTTKPSRLPQSLSTDSINQSLSPNTRRRKTAITSVTSPLAEDKFGFDEPHTPKLPNKETTSDEKTKKASTGDKPSTYVYRPKKSSSSGIEHKSIPTKTTPTNDTPPTYKYVSSVQAKKASVGSREGSGRLSKKSEPSSLKVLSSPIRSKSSAENKSGRNQLPPTRSPDQQEEEPDPTMSILGPLDSLINTDTIASQPARPFSPTSPALSQEDDHQPDSKSQAGDEDQLTYIYRSTLLKKGVSDSPTKNPLSRTSSNKSLSSSPQHESHTLTRITSPRKASVPAQSGTLTRQSRLMGSLRKSSTPERASMKRKSSSLTPGSGLRPKSASQTDIINRKPSTDVKPKVSGLSSSRSMSRVSIKSKKNSIDNKPVSKAVEKVKSNKSSKQDSHGSTESESSSSPSTPSPHPPKKDTVDGGVASKQSLPKGKPPTGKAPVRESMSVSYHGKDTPIIPSVKRADTAIFDKQSTINKSKRGSSLKKFKPSSTTSLSPERTGSLRRSPKRSADAAPSTLSRSSMRASRRTSAGNISKLNQQPGSNRTLKRGASPLSSAHQPLTRTPSDEAAFSDFDHISSLAGNRMGSSVADHKRAVRPAARQKPSSSHLQMLQKRDNVSTEITTPTKTPNNFDANAYSTYMGKKVLDQSAVVGLAAKLDFSTVKLKKTGIVEQMMSEGGGAGKPMATTARDANNYGVPVTSHPVMLLMVKGRKQVQTRLVEPSATSINSGDVFILVGGKDLFLWQGKESNVIEKARGTDLVNRICQKKELGSIATSFVKLEDDNHHNKKEQVFWDVLKGKSSSKLGINAVPTDEVYEKGANMSTRIYQYVQEGESAKYVLLQEATSVMPKISILDSKKILLFDFYGEVYVWIGKSSTQSLRKPAVVRARKMFDNGCVPPSYNNPVPSSPTRKVSVAPGTTTRASGRFRPKTRQVALNASIRKKTSKTGTLERKPSKSELKPRPSWALFARVTEGSEMLLFREKFSDWPEPGRIIKMKGHESSGEVVKAPMMPELQPADVKAMLKAPPNFEGLRLEGENVHRGRGNYKVNRSSFACNRVRGLSAIKWHIKEFDNVKIPEIDNCIFYSGESYVIRWAYTITVVRELEGLTPGQGIFARDRQYAKEVKAKGKKDLMEADKMQRSKKMSIKVREEDVCSSDDGVDHSDEESKRILESGGRDRSAFFFWQGKTASINEKGAAAVMTVELDIEKSPQIRVPQGKEHPAFLQLFNGAMIVLRGKSESDNNLSKCQTGQRLYYSGGAAKKEAYLIEIDVQQPVSYYCRSRGCLLLQHMPSKSIYVWVGCQATFVQKSVALYAAKYLKKRLDSSFEVLAVHEGAETDSVAELFEIGDRQQYLSLLNISTNLSYTPRLFHLTSAAGWFVANEEVQVSRPSTADAVNAFPFLQEDLYSADQPALFIVDGCSTIYLWLGWWPQQKNKLLQEKNLLSGTALSRWARDKKLALQTVLNYAEECKRNPAPKVYVVTAGREHQDFINLFPTWNIDRDVEEIVKKSGESGPCRVEASVELTKYTRTSYTLAELQKRPEEVDLHKLETYLSDAEFEATFKITRDEFAALLPWKQIKLKKEVGLF